MRSEASKHCRITIGAALSLLLIVAIGMSNTGCVVACGWESARLIHLELDAAPGYELETRSSNEKTPLVPGDDGRYEVITPEIPFSTTYWFGVIPFHSSRGEDTDLLFATHPELPTQSLTVEETWYLPTRENGTAVWTIKHE